MHWDKHRGWFFFFFFFFHCSQYFFLRCSYKSTVSPINLKWIHNIRYTQNCWYMPLICSVLVTATESPSRASKVAKFRGEAKGWGVVASDPAVEASLLSGGQGCIAIGVLGARQAGQLPLPCAPLSRPLYHLRSVPLGAPHFPRHRWSLHAPGMSPSSQVQALELFCYVITLTSSANSKKIANLLNPSIGDPILEPIISIDCLPWWNCQVSALHPN